MSDEIILKADNKSSAIKDIISIIPDYENALPLEKTTIKEIRSCENSSYTDNSYPTKYALINNNEEQFTIEVDYTPDTTYHKTDETDKRLIINYYPMYRILGERNDYSEFDDYDETNLSRGKWKLPSDWHKLIIDGAMAIMYPELKEQWEAECNRKKSGQYLNAGLKLKSFLGVGNRSGR